MFFFYLSPVAAGEINIFALQDIPKGAKLPLFADGDYKLWKPRELVRLDPYVRRELMARGVLDDTGLHGPKSLNRMSIGWYITHSNRANTVIDDEYNYYARHCISAHCNITVDFRTLGDTRYPKKPKSYYKPTQK